MVKLPTIDELIKDAELSKTDKDNDLMVLLNQNPPKDWVKKHPTAKKKVNGVEVPIDYIPVERMEYILRRLFGRFWVEVRDFKEIKGATAVSVRVFVKNPISGEIEWNDGLGGTAVQTKKDTGEALHSGVMLALPSAESYAFKDACEKWGKIFGSDLNRDADISYDSLLKTPPANSKAEKEKQRLIAMIENCKTPDELYALDSNMIPELKALYDAKLMQLTKKPI